ncbi:unnamed protein product [Rangifer tarandus platyrhynchus]|uniref:Uncharacterized protein n=2 Tax=Rangifer tarandus platyrhynchus TaxID=3082113 RepID=A0ABN8Y266_RANTA|nr:unnamed protein product [Rangifer tarandus platyrhynchus]
MLASQLPPAIPGAREKGSLLVRVPPALSPGGDGLGVGGKTGQPRPAWGRLARPPCPPPRRSLSFAAARVSGRLSLSRFPCVSRAVSHAPSVYFPASIWALLIL